MKPEQIVHVLLEVEEPFDAREYLTQSSLEHVAKSLGLEWLNWGVWYKEIGPWRLYVDPWEKQPWMEVEVGMDTGNDQLKIVDAHVDQQAADTILPAVVGILTQHQDHAEKHHDGNVGSMVLAVLKPHIVYESEDFDARQFFSEMPDATVEDALLKMGFKETGEDVYVYVRGLFKVYAHTLPYKDYVEVEVSYEPRKQLLLSRDCNRETAIAGVKAVADTLYHHNWGIERAQDWRQRRSIIDRISRALDVQFDVVTERGIEESEDFDARAFFNEMEPKAAQVALELGFERDVHGFRKVIGQWVVDITAGEGESVVDVRRDFGWQREMKGMWYAKDDRVGPLVRQVVAICQAHTDENGWAVGDEQAYQEFGAIPK